MVVAKNVPRPGEATRRLLNMVSTLRYDDLPSEIVEMVKGDVLDCLGVSMAGAAVSPAARKMIAFATSNSESEDSRILGDGRRTSAPMAALANASSAHALNYDDSSDPLMTHLGCVIFPSALAVAEKVSNVNGREFIAAYAASLDVMARLSRATQTKEDHPDWNEHGWLLTQLVGYFGAALVAGRLLHLTAEDMASAIGLAHMQAAGNKQALIAGGADKSIYPGFPAAAGVSSALMAKHGLRGAVDPIEGRNGFYQVFFGGHYDRGILTSGLGSKFERVGFYAYPCCGFTHSRIDLAIRLMREHAIAPRDIESIQVAVGPISRLLCEPLPLRRAPQSMGDAQYSLPFTIATAVVRGAPTIDHFVETGLQDAETLAMAERIHYEMDTECDPQYGSGLCPARLVFRLTDGRTIAGENRDIRRGHPDNPLTRSEITRKFEQCAAYAGLDRGAARVISERVWRLDDLDDVGQVLA